MRVLFLDIDGVLNSDDWDDRLRDDRAKPIIDQYPYCLFDPDAISRLNRIHAETSCLLVVSSMWRTGHTETQLQGIFDRVGIIPRIHSYTPIGQFQHPSGLWSAGTRGEEIAAWQRENEFNYANNRYVILDDLKDEWLECQLPYLVQTDFDSGLTDELTDRAIAILLAAK
jgi:hypothetical protein